MKSSGKVTCQKATPQWWKLAFGMIQGCANDCYEDAKLSLARLLAPGRLFDGLDSRTLPQSGNKLVSGMWALTIGDFSTTKEKYLSMPMSMSVRRSMIVWYSPMPAVTNFRR